MEVRLLSSSDVMATAGWAGLGEEEEGGRGRGDCGGWIEEERGEAWPDEGVGGAVVEWATPPEQ